MFLTKLDLLLPRVPATVSRGIYPKELKTYTHTKTCAWMYVTALFRITNTWKQPSRPQQADRYVNRGPCGPRNVIQR